MRGGVRRYRLHIADGTEPTKSGQMVFAKGLTLENELVIQSSAVLETISEAPLISSLGVQRTLVLLINFRNNTTRPKTVENIRAQFFGSTNSVDVYYKEQSFNKTGFSGDVVDWVTVPYDIPAPPSCNDGIDLSPFEKAAEDNARAKGKDPDNYHRIAYFYTKMEGCNWFAYGQLRDRRSGYNGYDGLGIFNHELGHNLGVHHANTLLCGSVAIAPYTSCLDGEYGDSWDNMGDSEWEHSYQFNGPHKYGMQWLTVSTLTVAAPGTFMLAPLEMDSAGRPQVLRIKKPDTYDIIDGLRYDHYYYISYRRPLGFDATLPTDIVNGASVHIWNGHSWGRTKLLDATPGDGRKDNAALVDNQHFGDPVNRISVMQTKHDTDSVTVRVDFKTTSVSGRVFNETLNQGYPDVTVSTCRTDIPSVKTNASGNFSFRVPIKGTFCVRITPVSQPDTSGPVLQPGWEGKTSYEFQVADWHCKIQGGCNDLQTKWDRSPDAGYLFKYRNI